MNRTDHYLKSDFRIAGPRSPVIDRSVHDPWSGPESVVNVIVPAPAAAPLRVLDLREQVGLGGPAAALREVAEQLATGQVPVPPPDMLALARRALDSQSARPEEPVLEWARRLAQDIAQPEP